MQIQTPWPRNCSVRSSCRAGISRNVTHARHPVLRVRSVGGTTRHAPLVEVFRFDGTTGGQNTFAAKRGESTRARRIVDDAGFRLHPLQVQVFATVSTGDDLQ